MPQRAWSKKRERQYQHIKDGLEERGYADDDAEEIAARTYDQLYEEAKRKNVRGRSSMSKRELERAVNR